MLRQCGQVNLGRTLLSLNKTVYAGATCVARNTRIPVGFGEAKFSYYDFVCSILKSSGLDILSDAEFFF